MMQLERNQPLVMIHADHGVIVPARGLMKETIRRKRPVRLHTSFLRRFHRRCDNLFFFVPENAFFSAVGIQSSHRDPWAREAEKVAQALVGQFERYPNAVARESAWNFARSNGTGQQYELQAFAYR